MLNNQVLLPHILPQTDTEMKLMRGLAIVINHKTTIVITGLTADIPELQFPPSLSISLSHFSLFLSAWKKMKLNEESDSK